MILLLGSPIVTTLEVPYRFALDVRLVLSAENQEEISKLDLILLVLDTKVSNFGITESVSKISAVRKSKLKTLYFQETITCT